MPDKHLARNAGKFVKHVLPAAFKPVKDGLPAIKHVDARNAGRNAGMFVKHVLPAAVKPVHSLWHEVLSFVFLAVAIWGVYWLYHHRETIGPVHVIIISPVIVVAVGYSVSSFLKARRISRS